MNVGAYIVAIGSESLHLFTPTDLSSMAQMHRTGGLCKRDPYGLI